MHFLCVESWAARGRTGLAAAFAKAVSRGPDSEFAMPSGPIGPACGPRLRGKPIETCAIGLKYARQAAGHTGSGCHEICVTEKDVLDVLDTVVYTLGTYDITAARPGMGM